MFKSRLVLALAALAISGAQAQQDRIVGAIDPGRVFLLKGNTHPQAQAQSDQGPADPALALRYMTLVLKPSPAQQAALRQLLTDQQDPASPQYHRWLTPEDYATQFGASPRDLAKISTWLKSAGFRIEYSARGADFIAFSGTAAQVQAAFHTAIDRYLVNGEKHFAANSDPSLPAALQSLAGAILGLHDFYPKPAHKWHSDCTGCNANAQYSLAPDDLATIYDLNRLYQHGFDGTGQSIAIVGESQLNMSDLQTFRSTFGLGSQNIRTILAGADPGINSDALGEADLDIEWAGAIARNASFFYIYSTNVDDATFYAIDQKVAPVISESWGGCEPNVPPDVALSYESEAQKGNSMGITWLASSDDTGAAGCDPHGVSAATLGLAVQIPSSIPEVTAVGGTEFNESFGIYWSPTNGDDGGSAISYIPEVAWNDTPFGAGIAAGGGGVSILYEKPSWQAGTGVPKDNARDVPDVAMAASADHDPYNVLSLGQWQGVGGTSASTPVFAGIVAILNQYLLSKGAQSQAGLGNINPALYAMAKSTPSAFHDIVFGDNIVFCEAGTTSCNNGEYGYRAGTGYDLVTGLGSVDAYNFVINWSGAPSNALAITSLSPTSAAAGGAAFTLAVSGTNFAAGAVVNWNGTPLPTTFVSSTQVKASVAANLIASAGTITITVSSGGDISGALYFSINPATPPPVTLTDARLTTQAPPSAGCVLPPEQSTFATSANTVYLYFAASITADDTLSNDWLAPDGTVVPGDYWSPEAGDFCFTGASLAVGNLSGAKLGAWTVRIYDNGTVIQSIPFTVGAEGSTAPTITSVKNAASYASGVVSPGEIVVLFGSGMGPANLVQLTLDSHGLVAAELSGTSVHFNGVASPMVYTLASQVAAVVPYEVTGTSAQVTVTYKGQTSAAFPVTVAAAVPALFTANASGAGEVAALNQDNTINSLTNSAAPSSVVVLFGTGEGQTSPAGVDGKLAVLPLPKPVQKVSVTIGGQPAQFAYAGGAPGEVAGVLQINATIPDGVFGNAVPVIIQIGNTQSPAGTTIAVAAPPGKSVFSVTSQETAASVYTYGDGSLNCIAPAAQNSFPTTAPNAYVYMTYDGAQAGDVLTFAWVHPSGKVDSSQPSITLKTAGSGCAAQPLAILGQEAATEPGTWQVRVSHNGSVQFTLPFSIVAPPSAFAVTAKETTGALATDASGNPEYCVAPTAKTAFLTTDPTMWVWFTFDGAKQGDVFTFRWTHPTGTIDSYQPTSVLSFNGAGCMAWPFQIAQSAASNNPGTWQVSVLRNGVQALSLPFTISSPTTNSFTVVDKVLSATINSDANNNLICQAPPPQTVFSTTSYAVWAYLSFDGATNGDLLTFKWFNPSGQEDIPDSGSFPITFQGSGCAAWGLGVSGYTAGTEPGAWQVGVYLNGKQLYTQAFTIQF